MFFVTQSNLSQVVMLLNCILVAPDLDLGREIKYSVAFHFLCPGRTNVGLAASARPQPLLYTPFQFIFSNYYTILHSAVWVNESVVK